MDMDSFTTKEPQFRYNPNSNQESEDSFSGTLQIHVHHARNIHNICIYEKQDVYAKFSLTYNPDETFSTKIINGGGKNPDFDEELTVKINQPDAVLKCEIWMMSRAKNYMDDQLLGFTLVSISSVYNKGKVTQDFDLSSTDLFHSPAGTVKLSLTLTAKRPNKMVPFADPEVKISELLLDKKVPDDYYRIEFPDINVVNENQLMVSEYFAKNGTFLKPWLEKTDGSFLHLGAAPQVHVEDYEMGGNSSEEYRADSISISPDGSVQNSDFQSSTTTSISDYRNSADSMDKTETPIVEKRTETHEKNDLKKEEVGNNDANKCSVSLVRNMKLEADESAMQQHIVDMYMRSMHQFTESLAKMKLPMDLGKGEGDEQGIVMQNDDAKIEIDQKKSKNKDNARVFYGSRAFF